MSRRASIAGTLRKSMKPILLATLLLLVFPGDAMACPNCREALAGTGRAIGYAFGILILMSTPFVLVGFWTTMIIRLRRRASQSNTCYGLLDPIANNVKIN